MAFHRQFPAAILPRLALPQELDADGALRLLRESGVRFLQLQCCDLFGSPRGVEVPASRFERALAGAVRFDGSSIDGHVRVEEQEMILCPDPSTLRLLPWGDVDGSTARLICDVQRLDGAPFEGDPRGALRRAVDAVAEAGFRAAIGVELEFFLFADQQGVAGGEARGGYFDVSPDPRSEVVIRDLVDVLDALDIQVTATHRENAPGQHKAVLLSTDPLRAADQVVTFRLAARSVARRHGHRAVFMPKPTFGRNGSGMHTFHVLYGEDGNAFHDPEARDGLSDRLRHYIGGLLEHARGYAAVTNPLVNSYKRLVPGFEAPLGVSWSLHNRSPLVRVPSARGDEAQCEVRLPDSSANPYLSFAVQLAAGLDGLRREVSPGDPVGKNLWDMSPRERARLKIAELPRSLGEALGELERDRVVRGALGEYIFSRYVEAKREEWSEYSSTVHAWEVERYLEG